MAKGVFGHTPLKSSNSIRHLISSHFPPVLGDVRPGDVSDVELHVDLVAGVHSHNLVLVI